MTGKDDKSPKTQNQPVKAAGSASREDRLGEALRANLRRRKAAAKARKKD